MWVSLFSMVLDNEILVHRMRNEKDEFNGNKLLVITEKLTYDIIYSMFFEDPKEYLCCIIIMDHDPDIKEIVYTATLDSVFYDKHIGKFIKEIQRRLINDIIIKFVTEMDEIDWRSV